MSKTIIEIDHICSGQPRPYADHVYEAYITMQGIGVLADPYVMFYNVKEEHAKELAKKYVHKWADEPGWAGPALKVFESVGLTQAQQKLVPEGFRKHLNNARWHVKIVQPYLD